MRACMCVRIRPALLVIAFYLTAFQPSCALVSLSCPQPFWPEGLGARCRRYAHHEYTVVSTVRLIAQPYFGTRIAPKRTHAHASVCRIVFCCDVFPGINRGFLHCLDCADLARGLAAAERKRRAVEQATFVETAQQHAQLSSERQSISRRGIVSDRAVDGRDGSPFGSPLARCRSDEVELGGSTPGSAFSSFGIEVDSDDTAFLVLHPECGDSLTYRASTATGGAVVAAAAPSSPQPARPPAAASNAEDFDFDAVLARLVARREDLYNCTKRISGNTQKMELKPTLDARRELRYRIDPASRYTHLPRGDDWEPTANKQRLEREAQMEVKRAEEAVAEATRQEEAKVRLQAAQKEAEVRYEKEFASWSAVFAAAQKSVEELESSCHALDESIVSRQATAEASREAAAEAQRTSLARRDALEQQHERLMARVGQQRFTIRDFENNRASLTEAQSSKLVQAQERLAATQAEMAEVAAKLDSGDHAEQEQLAIAEAAESELVGLRAQREQLKPRLAVSKDEVTRLRRREPEKPVHMLDYTA